MQLLTVNNILTPQVVYGTDRSKAMVPVFFLFCAPFCLYYGALYILKSSRALCPRVSSFFSIVITTLREEGAGLYASRAFVCLLCTC